VGIDGEHHRHHDDCERGPHRSPRFDDGLVPSVAPPEDITRLATPSAAKDARGG
jgi:hypothetical protein